VRACQGRPGSQRALPEGERMRLTIRQIFGRLFRRARDRKGLSRVALGKRIGVCHNAIQAWEDGRNFIADLSLIPKLDAALGISVLRLMRKAMLAAPKVLVSNAALRAFKKAAPQALAKLPPKELVRRSAISAALKRYIIKSGMRYDELAKRAKVHLTMIYRFMNGKGINITNADRIAIILHLKLCERKKSRR